MVPIGVAQYMAYQPDIEQRVLHGGAVYAEQMAGGPSIGPAVQQQYKDAQQREGQDDRGVILQPQGEGVAFHGRGPPFVFFAGRQAKQVLLYHILTDFSHFCEKNSFLPLIRTKKPHPKAGTAKAASK